MCLFFFFYSQWKQGGVGDGGGGCWSFVSVKQEERRLFFFFLLYLWRWWWGALAAVGVSGFSSGQHPRCAPMSEQVWKWNVMLVGAPALTWECKKWVSICGVAAWYLLPSSPESEEVCWLIRTFCADIFHFSSELGIYSFKLWILIQSACFYLLFYIVDYVTQVWILY